MTEPGDAERKDASDQATIAAGVVIALGLLFCVVMFLVAG